MKFSIKRHLEREEKKRLQNIVANIGSSASVQIGELMPSVLERAKLLRASSKQMEDVADDLKTEISKQTEVIDGIKGNEVAIIEENVSKQKADYATKLEQAQKYAQKNAKAIADKVDELNNARDILAKLLSEYSSEEQKSDNDLFEDLRRKEITLSEILSALGTTISPKAKERATSQVRGQIAGIKEKLAANASKRDAINAQRALIDGSGELVGLKEQLSSMQALAAPPRAVSDETMLENARQEYQEVLQAEIEIKKSLETQRGNVLAELSTAMREFSGLMARLRRGIQSGLLKEVATYSTESGFEELVQINQKNIEELKFY